jgi:hypothetical protein
VLVEFSISVGSVNAIAAAHPEFVATARQVGLEQVRDEAGEAALQRVDDWQYGRDRRRALDARARLTPASPEALTYLANQREMQRLIDAQTGGVSGLGR